MGAAVAGCGVGACGAITAVLGASAVESEIGRVGAAGRLIRAMPSITTPTSTAASLWPGATQGRRRPCTPRRVATSSTTMPTMR